MGTAIAGRYVLLGPIGFGGVSVVYQAVDVLHAQPLAVKLLAPTFAGDAYARAKVHHEALITKRLRHPSVPRIYDFGDAVLPDGSVLPYVAMELLSGSVLANRLAEGALPWREAVTISATVADVLAIAHRRGVVHRDLTPVNIMMTPTGVKIIDFGEATTIEAESQLALAVPLPVRPVTDAETPADDVYALGVLLDQMLTGRSPYPTTEPGNELAAARMRHAAPTPVLNVPGMPRQVAEICRACMARRPEERPDSATVALSLWALLLPGGEGYEPGPGTGALEANTAQLATLPTTAPPMVAPARAAPDRSPWHYALSDLPGRDGLPGPAGPPQAGLRTPADPGPDFAWWQRPDPGIAPGGLGYVAAGRPVPHPTWLS